ncbi:MAG: Pyridoxamine 5-phosphate oxidase family protein [Actinomycetota bacterium]|jgi:nitroimidazol reductase NimA-like FMN-containing flavoprotein (pyridoxamine 5'-phosphate oxidase superfamily)|nr:Pyridoxamine 5-phosphate oxidase family protein [Actinomycetota bacterium]
MRERQSTDRADLDALLAATPLATIAFVRDGHPVALPIGFARIDDEVVIHGSSGSPWLRQLAEGCPAAVSVTTLEGVLLARSGFESSFHYRSAVLFGRFTAIDKSRKDDYLRALTDVFIPGRVAELRPSTSKELAATLVLAMPIETWSLKTSFDWPEDPEEDVAAGGWAGVVPIVTRYGTPVPAPDCDPAIPFPPSVRAMLGSDGV